MIRQNKAAGPYLTNGNDSTITKIKQAAGDKLGGLLY
jgi:hypothetical protein